MEKNLEAKGCKEIKDVEIINTSQGDQIIFALKEPKAVSKNIIREIKEEMSIPTNGSAIIYTDFRLINTNNLLVQDYPVLI